MASMFQTATKVQRYLKIIAYGPIASGKTWFALSFAEAGPLAVIDMEGGTAFYGDKFNFDRLQTKDYPTVMRSIAELKTSNHYKTVVIDPITVLWETLQDAKRLQIERSKAKNKADDEYIDATLTNGDWGTIKARYKRLMTELVNLPMNVVLIAREKEQLEGDKVVARIMDTERSTKSIPDFILHFDGTPQFTATVEKQRGGVFKVGQKLIAPTYKTFEPAIVTTGNKFEMQNDDDAAKSTAAALEHEDRTSTQQRLASTRATLNEKTQGTAWQAAHQEAPTQQPDRSAEANHITVILRTFNLGKEVLANMCRKYNIKKSDGHAAILAKLQEHDVIVDMWTEQNNVADQMVAYIQRTHATVDQLYETISDPDNAATLLEALKEGAAA